jgi:hypothetical protein
LSNNAEVGFLTVSRNFTLFQRQNAWGARGPEFKSRRSDQSFRTSIIGLVDTFMDTLQKQGTVREAIPILLPRSGVAAGRYLSGLIKGGRARDLIEEAIAEAKREARAKGLTDSEIDAELRAWRSEQRT